MSFFHTLICFWVFCCGLFVHVHSLPFFVSPKTNPVLITVGDLIDFQVSSGQTQPPVSLCINSSIQGEVQCSPFANSLQISAFLSPGVHSVQACITLQNTTKSTCSQPLFVAVRPPPEDLFSYGKTLLKLEELLVQRPPPLQNGIYWLMEHIPKEVYSLLSPNYTGVAVVDNPSVLHGTVGNRKLSIGISARGTVATVRYPASTALDDLEFFVAPWEGLEFLPTMGMSFGIVGDQSISWSFDSSAWTSSSQEYLSDEDNILLTTLTDLQNEQITITDFVPPNQDVLVRRISSPTPRTFVHYENLAPCNYQIERLPLSDWALDFFNDFGAFVSVDGIVVHFRPYDISDSVFQAALNMTKKGQFDPSKFGPGSYYAISAQDWKNSFATVGPVGDQAISVDFSTPSTFSFGRVMSAVKSAKTTNFTVLIAAGNSVAEVVAKVKAARETQWGDMVNATQKYWRSLVSNAVLPKVSASSAALKVSKRAVITVVSAMDTFNGTIAASIDSQVPYAFDWVRDGSFITSTLLNMGLIDLAKRHSLFYPLVVRGPEALFVEGSYSMNFAYDGQVGGPIPLEIDEAGLSVWQMTLVGSQLSGSDLTNYVSQVCPAIQKTLNWLWQWRDPSNNLPLPANEDDNLAFTQGIQGSTAAFLALNSGGLFAQKVGCGGPTDHQRWASRAVELREAIIKEFYSPDCQCWGLGDTPDKAQPLRGAAWFLYPAEIFPPGSPEAAAQAAALAKTPSMQNFISTQTSSEAQIFGYVAEVLRAVAHVWRNQSAGDISPWCKILATQVPTNTGHYGEFYERKPDGKWHNLNDVPHVWESTLLYDLVLENPSQCNY